MKHTASPSDNAYLQSFLDCTLDAEAFHHREHLRIAYTLLARHNLDEAHGILKQGILELLSHLGAGDGKYHETITYAWLVLVQRAMEKSRAAESFGRFIARNQKLLSTSLLEHYYSPAVLGSEVARTGIVKPDKAALK